LLIRIDIGADDAVDVFGNHSGPLHRRYGRESAEVRGLQGRILGKDMPLADASAGGDPLVRGIHHFLKVGIGQDVFGMVNPYAADDRAHQATWLNLAAIFSATLLLASLYAVSSPFLMTLAFARPWVMRPVPFKPSSMAAPKLA